MKQRYMLKCAVFLILTKYDKEKEHILLQKRYNTGLLDGKYDVSCSGHLEKGESLQEAMIREAKEEIGIDIDNNDLKYVSTIHTNFDGDEYLFIVFSTDRYEGNPSIMEPNKCNKLKWFDINDLPNEIIETRRLMINSYINDNLYSECGFKN